MPTWFPGMGSANIWIFWKVVFLRWFFARSLRGCCERIEEGIWWSGSCRPRINRIFITEPRKVFEFRTCSVDASVFWFGRFGVKRIFRSRKVRRSLRRWPSHWICTAIRNRRWWWRWPENDKKTGWDESFCNRNDQCYNTFLERLFSGVNGG